MKNLHTVSLVLSMTKAGLASMEREILPQDLIPFQQSKGVLLCIQNTFERVRKLELDLPGELIESASEDINNILAFVNSCTGRMREYEQREKSKDLEKSRDSISPDEPSSDSSDLSPSGDPSSPQGLPGNPSSGPENQGQDPKSLSPKPSGKSKPGLARGSNPEKE